MVGAAAVGATVATAGAALSAGAAEAVGVDEASRKYPPFPPATVGVNATVAVGGMPCAATTFAGGAAPPACASADCVCVYPTA